jgi:EAL domain-containing protein (putative c-di-GMP-specific phosphodiesterase class I)/CHASE2 domain-containing sensor protein
MIAALRQRLRDRPRVRIFFWAFLIALVCGAINAGEPLEDTIKAGRDVVRAQPSAGDIVVVGVDEKTGAHFGGFGYSRKVDAAFVDRLFALGAKRVFFDKVYADTTTPEGDEAFLAALRRHRGRVFLGVASPKLENGTPVETLPHPIFRQAAQVRSLNGLSTPFTLSANLTLADRFSAYGDQLIPSLSAALAERTPSAPGHYRPDWSIRIKSIPSFSFVDVVTGKVTAADVAGKDIVVGWTAQSFQDWHNVLSQGQNPGVYFHVVGAETLRRGDPRHIGWLPAFAVAVLLSVMFLVARRRSTQSLLIATAVAMFGVLPIYLDAKLIESDVVAALMLFTIVAYRGIALRRVEATRRTHPTSELPNLVALEEAEAHGETLIAAKLRNFSEIATSFPTNVERELFQELARRIRVSGDVGTVYHGEDALLWYTEQPMGQELANHLMGLHKLSSQSVRIGDRDVDLLLAFGVDADAQRPISSRIASAILSAEEAARAHDVWKFYDPERLHQAAWQLSLMSRLTHAVEGGEIWVAYQPKVDLPSRRIVGAEALVRWNHPTAGTISPDQFITAAEQHNRIGELTWFVLERALRDLAALRGRGHDIGMAVNLSSQMLTHADLVDRVAALLVRYEVPPAKLTLEVTETGELLSSPAKVKTMERLASTGVQISIDDYGTGNATLEYLSRLPSQEVKIDRTFITDLDRNAQNLILVRSTLEMAHRLGRSVVAEGVENEGVMRVLRELGCDIAQGYLLGRPLPLAQLESMLDADLPSPKLRVVIS